MEQQGYTTTQQQQTADVDEFWKMRKEEKKKARRKKEIEEQPLIITSLLDAFTIILVFLLKSYGSDPVNIQQSDILKLPKSEAKLPLKPATVIAITRNAILVDEKKVVDLQDGSVDPSAKRDGANGFFITPLYEALNEAAQNQKRIAARNPAVQFTGLALILADRLTNFRLLTEVLYTAGQAEFNQFKFAIVQGYSSHKFK